MEKLFNRWWAAGHDGYCATPLMERCFAGGFWCGFRIAMLIVAVAALALALGGCQDHYRYPCQNPDNFANAECQKPKCLFTQQCPEYLVAPVLEKQVNAQQQPASEAAPQR